MKEYWSILFLIEAIGTVAFAISGTMVAFKKNFDLLGCIVLGSVTAVGGGLIRDILIGKMPASMFQKPIYVILASVVVIILFIAIRWNRPLLKYEYLRKLEQIVNVFDAIGLGTFTVVGLDVAISAGYEEYKFFVIFLGVITGVGGGLIRDVLAGRAPSVMQKHIYVCASMVGAVFYELLIGYVEQNLVMIISASVIIIIRLCATYFRWNLPKAVLKK